MPSFCCRACQMVQQDRAKFGAIDAGTGAKLRPPCHNRFWSQQSSAKRSYLWSRGDKVVGLSIDSSSRQHQAVP